MNSRSWGPGVMFGKAVRFSLLVFTLTAIAQPFESPAAEPARVSDEQPRAEAQPARLETPGRTGGPLEEREGRGGIWWVGGFSLIVVGAGSLLLFVLLRRKGPRWASDGEQPNDPIAVSLTLPEKLRIEVAMKTELSSERETAGRLEGLETNIKNILDELRTLGDQLSRVKGEQPATGVLARTRPVGDDFAEPTIAGRKERFPEMTPVEDEILLFERPGSEPSRGQYSIEIMDTIERKSRSSGDLVTVKQLAESRWEVYGIEKSNFNTILNNLFVLTEQGGVIKSTIKPATIMGKREGHTISVQELAKGTLETGRPT